MNSHARAVLEVNRVLERIAARTGTWMGRDHALALKPSSDPASIRTELGRVAEVMGFAQSFPDWTPPIFPDVSEPLEGLEPEGGVLRPDAILALLRLLVSSRTLSDQLHQTLEDGGDDEAIERFPQLAALRARLPVDSGRETQLARIVDDEGVVRDKASSALRSLRIRLRTLRGSMVRELEKYMESLSGTYRVEGASVSIRDGRYVVPIRREGRSHVGGVIHGESATGATLFVEPPLAIRLMNDVHDLEREEAREIHRILKEATDSLRTLRTQLSEGFQAQVELDSLRARALAALAWDAAVPELLDSDHTRFVIVEGRHPLLLENGGEAVPFSLELDAEERVVVISGPNTGGKTVLLKALGLIHLLVQSGVIPPVGQGTRLPILSDVFADIGDEQSIAESLSTFSAHIENAREILAGAGPGTLVLMDELGTGTDPTEGAALARVILERLVEVGARGFVTSHLDALKHLDDEGSGIVNASLLFDADRLAPTYHLQKGRPGRSFGLAIARRLGFSGELLDRAEKYVGTDELRLEGLLETLERKERDLASALEDAHAAGAEARLRRDKAERQQADLDVRQRSLKKRVREEARSLLLEARQEVEAAIRELKGSETDRLPEAARRARRRIEDAAHAQRTGTFQASRPWARPPARSISLGDRVRVLGSGALGVIRELRGRRATVEAGGPEAPTAPRGDRAGGWGCRGVAGGCRFPTRVDLDE